MAETVRIDAEAYAELTEIAKEMHISLTVALSKAIECCRREMFLKGVVDDFSALRAEEHVEEQAEREVWDATNTDGLTNE